MTEEDKTTLLHGEAIAIGMILEAYLSVVLLNLPEKEAEEIKEVFDSIYPKVNFTEEEIDAILSLLIYDKKTVTERFNFAY